MDRSQAYGVDMDPLGGIIGGLGSLVGGIFQSQAAQANNAANIAEQNYLASNSVSLRVADAARAGINPLTALGAGTPNFSPTPADAGLGQGIAGMGAGIERAIAASTADNDKAKQMGEQLSALKIEQAKNDVVYGQLRNSSLARAFAAAGNGGSVPNTTVVEENFRGAKGPPIYAPMYDPVTGKTVMFPTRDASARSFGSLGEPTSRALGDISAASNLYRQLTPSAGDLFPDTFHSGVVTVRPDVTRGGKIGTEYPFGDYPFIGD